MVQCSQLISQTLKSTAGLRCCRNLRVCLAGLCIFQVVISPRSVKRRTYEFLHYIICTMSATFPHTPWTRTSTASSGASDSKVRREVEVSCNLILSVPHDSQVVTVHTVRYCTHCQTLYEWMALGKSTTLIRRNWTSPQPLCCRLWNTAGALFRLWTFDSVDVFSSFTRSFNRNVWNRVKFKRKLCARWL